MPELTNGQPFESKHSQVGLLRRDVPRDASILAKANLIATQEGLGNSAQVSNYSAVRKALIAKEKLQRSDYEFRQSLSPTAKAACEIVLRIRHEEKCTIWKTEGNPELNQEELFPGMMFNVAKGHMESTKLWEIVRKMPKGALLHAHIGATVDLEWVFNEAINTPGMCISSSTPLTSEHTLADALLKIRFAGPGKTEAPSIWDANYPAGSLVPLKTAANEFPGGGRAGFVAWIKDRCSITKADTLKHHLGVDDVWRKLSAGFVVLGPIIYYEPILRSFLQKLFTTLLEDGVYWAELRAVFTSQVTLQDQEVPVDGVTELPRLFSEEIAKFMATDSGKDFWGVRFIWTAMRAGSTAKIIKDMEDCIAAKKKWPNLIQGYDLVGPEDLGRTLRDLSPELIWFQDACTQAGVEIPFFFHAGECLGDGDSTDQNLFDAILFGTRRLGHAFSLYKHPLLIDMVKEKKILVECCPISNEALRYSASILSHPLPALLARGVPAALSNDDPSLLGQETSGLTHDFWQALQGWENLGLAGLGSLAENSVRWAVFEDQNQTEWLQGIQDGATGATVRAERMRQWGNEWEKFCAWIVNNYTFYNSSKGEAP